jgi:hypothetical protein
VMKPVASLLAQRRLLPCCAQYLNTPITESALYFYTLCIAQRVYKPAEQVLRVMAAHISQDVLIRSRQAGPWAGNCSCCVCFCAQRYTAGRRELCFTVGASTLLFCFLIFERGLLGCMGVKLGLSH